MGRLSIDTLVDTLSPCTYVIIAQSLQCQDGGAPFARQNHDHDRFGLASGPGLRSTSNRTAATRAAGPLVPAPRPLRARSQPCPPGRRCGGAGARGIRHRRHRDAVRDDARGAGGSLGQHLGHAFGLDAPPARPPAVRPLACAAGMMPAELDHITECSEACTDLGGSVL